jgi:hypothetical protein
MIAYIDPGSGSYFFQLLIGGLLGGAVAMKLWWRRIWAFLTRRRSRRTDRTEGGPPDRSPGPTTAERASPREG